MTRAKLVNFFGIGLALCLALCPGLIMGCKSTASEQSNADRNGKIELARQFVDTGQHTKAVNILQELSKRFPDSPDVYYIYGLALLGLGDVGSARLRLEKAVELNDDYDDARLSLAYTNIVLKRFSEAREQLLLILKRDTYYYLERVHVNLGLIELEKGNCQKAMPEFEAAIEIDPTLVTAYFNKGKCLVKLGKLRQAVENLEKASSFCPGCGEPQIELARAQIKLGLRKEAVVTLKDIIARSENGAAKSTARAMLGNMTKQKR
jgi:Tfp pilus assembly protein PilF